MANDLVFNDNDLNDKSSVDVTNALSIQEQGDTLKSTKVSDIDALDSTKKDNLDKGDDKPTKTDTPSDSPSTDDKKDVVDNKDTETKTTDTEPKGEVDEDDVEIFIDEKTGNLVDSEGKVYAEKGKFQVDDEGNVTLDDDAAVVVEENYDLISNQIKQDYGIDLVDENNEPIKFESTPQGISKLAGFIGEKLHQQQLNELFTEMPKLKSYFDHILANGDDSNFFNKETNYRSITIPEDTDKNKDSNKSLRRNILIQKELLMRGAQNLKQEELLKLQEDVAEYVDFIFDKGQEVEKSKDALTWLHSYQQQVETARDTENQRKITERKEANDKYWSNVEEVITKGELANNIVIPKNERDAFFTYLAKPVGNTGKSQSMIDRAEAPHSQGLLLEYLRFKKFDLEKFIEAKANTKQAEKLRLISSNSRDKLSKSTGLKIKTKGVSLDKINLQYLSQQK